MVFSKKRVHVLTFILLALILFCETHYKLVRGAIINDVSMEPNLIAGQYVIYERFSLLTGNLHRGDVVAIKNNKLYVTDDFEKVPKALLVKRIVGMPGETVYGKNCGLYVGGLGTVTAKVEESYSPYRSCESFSVGLGSGQYFVLGDNRPHSEDSRDFGPVPENLIVGKVALQFEPNIFSTVYWYFLTRS
jgi:signal peptidase I